MKISRWAILFTIAFGATIGNMAVRGDAEPSATQPSARPAGHNVLRAGPGDAAASSVTNAAGGISEGPTLVGPALVGPQYGAIADGAAKPNTPPAAKPADTSADAKSHHNALRNMPATVRTVGDDSTPTSPTTSPAAAGSATTSKPKPNPLTAPAINGAKPLSGGSSTKPAPVSPLRGPTTVISDSAATKSAADRRPNSMLNSGDEELGKRAEVTKRPADAGSKKLFESSTDPKLTPEMEVLRKRVQTALATYYHNWTLNTAEHSPWEVMHAIIAYGVDTRLRHNGQNTTAIGHLCFSGVSNKMPIVTLKNDKIYVLRGPGVQGHSGQFLAILAQSHLQRDYPLHVNGHSFTLEDLIDAEKADCESGTELTFKLIGLMHYLPSDASWTNFQGQTWSIDRLVREEIVQPIRGAACGGTHRLMGLSYAIAKREQRGESISGIYKEAEKYIDQYHKYTLGLQNPDGSFSTAWFVRREARLDLDRRLQTTGHILEWLCFSMTDEQLRDPRIVRSVKYVTDLLLDETDHSWEVGHLGHALHALQLYNERIFGGPIRSYEGLVLRRTIKTAQQTKPDDSTNGNFQLPFKR
jgi:hypothetical protein